MIITNIYRRISFAKDEKCAFSTHILHTKKSVTPNKVLLVLPHVRRSFWLQFNQKMDYRLIITNIYRRISFAKDEKCAFSTPILHTKKSVTPNKVLLVL